jgi:Rrf2 family iron-sulfur cluster assembly transcriptional regulator
MIDLAEHTAEGYIPMKDVAQRQDISLKYMEKILPSLVKDGLIEGVHGRSGGYRLTRSPEKYPVGEILRLTEGELVPVACMERDAEPCRRTADCRTRPMWSRLGEIVGEYLDSVTIADLMRQNA